MTIDRAETREERLDAIVECVARLEARGEAPGRKQLVKSVKSSWEVTEQTARDYVETLELGDRLTTDRLGNVVLTEAEKTQREEEPEQAKLSTDVKEEVIG